MSTTGHDETHPPPTDVECPSCEGFGGWDEWGDPPTDTRWCEFDIVCPDCSGVGIISVQEE